MGLVQIGPVSVGADEHGNPSWSWDADPTANDSRAATIAGLLTWRQADQLNEFVDAAGMLANVRGDLGVLAWVHFTGAKLGPRSGWYLLQGMSFSPTKPSTMSDYTAPVSIKALYLGSGRVPELVRSARTRPNVYGLDGRSTVANPFYSAAGEGFAMSTGGGPTFAREYNAAMEGDLPVSALAAISSGTTLLVDSLLPAVFPILDGPLGDAPPLWATLHGGDPRGYDRRQMNQVWSRSHVFAATTDAQITNGLVTLWCGARGVPAHVGVSVFHGDVEHQVGNLALSDVDDILSVRICDVTTDRVSMTVSVRNVGDVTLTLRRATPIIDVTHGDLRPPAPLLARIVRWLGMAPARAITGASATASARYGAGVALSASGQLGFAWPPTLPVTEWAYGHNWTPSAASSSQPSSGLWSVWSAGAAAGTVTWDSATKTLRWRQGANTLASAPLTFAAGAHVSWSVSFSTATGMALTVSINGAAAARVTAPSFVDPGTAEVAYDSHWIGGTVAGFGAGIFGAGIFGGSGITADLGGAVSNAMLFAGPLTAAEAGVLAVSTSRLGGLPTPWSRLVGYWPFEAKPVPLGSAVTSGRRFEATTDGGSTRAPDGAGLTKSLVALAAVSSASPGNGFGLTTTAQQLLLAATVATTATGDDVTDHQLELAAANRVALSAR